MSTYVHIFDSVDDLLRQADESADKRGSHYDVSEDPGWVGRQFRDWKDVVDKANLNWPLGQQIVEKMIEELGHVELPAIKCVRRRRKWSPDDGDEVEIDRLRNGQDYWSTSERQEMPGCPIITIVVNVTTPAYEKPDNILWRGAVGCILANLLENAGYRVEVWGAQNTAHAYQDGSDMFQAVCIKAADRPLDIATVISSLAGWFYRTVYFQAYYVEPKSRPQGCLGRCLSIRESMPEVRALVGAGNKCVIIQDVWSRSAAIEKVRQVVTSLT